MRTRLVGLVFATLLALLAWPAPGDAYPRPGQNELISKSIVAGGPAPAGSVSVGGVTPTDGGSMTPEITPNGRWVTFVSGSPVIVAGDTNGGTDVFTYDRATGRVSMDSVSSLGVQGVGVDATYPMDISYSASISPNARYVSFVSWATNLVPGDTNLEPDVFLHDRWTGKTIRVDVSSAGAQAKGNQTPSIPATMSANGRFVAFSTVAANLAKGASAGTHNLYIRDTRTRTTRLISAGAIAPSMTPDGRYIVYTQNTSGLDGEEVYRLDRATGRTKLVDVALAGGPPTFGGTTFDNRPQWPDARTISANGRFVAFSSGSNDIVPNDQNTDPFTPIPGSGQDVFVRDLVTGRTERVSVTSDGGPGPGLADDMSISPDGRYVAFYGPASLDPSAPSRGVTCEPLVLPGGLCDGDLYVHDMLTGATELLNVNASGGEGNCGSAGYDTSSDPELSAGGRFVAFSSCDQELVKGVSPIPAGSQLVYVRDRGPALGVGRGSSLAGQPSFSTTGIASRVDPSSDLSPVLTATGANLIGASMAYRPQLGDLFVREELRSMPSVSGVPSGGLLYGFDLTANDARYEVRVQRVPGPDYDQSGGASFALFKLVGGIWTHVATLHGGYGTTGDEVVFALPLKAIGAQNGGRLSHLLAFTALGSLNVGAATALDQGRL